MFIRLIQMSIVPLVMSSVIVATGGVAGRSAGMAADGPRLRVDEHLRLDGVGAMFLATSLGLPIEAVGLLIAVDWFTGIFRTFLNVNGDTILAMLVAKPTNEIDVDVYRGRKPVESERVDLEAMEESFAKADAAD